MSDTILDEDWHAFLTCCNIACAGLGWKGLSTYQLDDPGIVSFNKEKNHLYILNWVALCFATQPSTHAAVSLSSENGRFTLHVLTDIRVWLLRYVSSKLHSYYGSEYGQWGKFAKTDIGGPARLAAPAECRGSLEAPSALDLLGSRVRAGSDVGLVGVVFYLGSELLCFA